MEMMKSGDDIHMIGRAVTACKDVRHPAEEFIGKLIREESERGRVVTDY